MLSIHATTELIPWLYIQFLSRSPCRSSPECFPADTPDHFFLSSADQPDLELLAALESVGKCGSSAGPSAAVTWLASEESTRERLNTPLLFLFPTNFWHDTRTSDFEIISLQNYNVSSILRMMQAKIKKFFQGNPK
jgi:hypothetical protein